MAYKAINMVYKSPLCTPLWLLFLLTHSTSATLASCFSSNMLSFLLPQDLCICFSLYLRWSYSSSGRHLTCSSMFLFSLITIIKQHICKHTGGDVRSFFYFLYLALFFSIAPNSIFICYFVLFFLSPIREYIPWRPFFCYCHSLLLYLQLLEQCLAHSRYSVNISQNKMNKLDHLLSVTLGKYLNAITF